ncbi:hypothetical protein [Pseudomonas mandelii]|uniref:Secreted peptide n=1 Tax=Pseudomonas mandelii TaxID=75612 RepID=A0ABY0VYC1_9PSED|nr:hypothetical protein [Pseudomonas mandelii]TWS10939.1 hypothetical protein FJD35_07870 [Pseudomonas mandelii]SDU63168.1 hypothetical protein SAMN04489801_5313 [Pseudomonas mandelii]
MLYITLLFMSAHVFSIRIVTIVALFCFLLVTGSFIIDYFYQATGSIVGYIRCLVSLVTVRCRRSASHNVNIMPSTKS